MVTNPGQFITQNQHQRNHLISSTAFMDRQIYVSECRRKMWLSFSSSTAPLSYFYTVDIGSYFGSPLEILSTHSSIPHSFFYGVPPSSALFKDRLSLSQLWNSSGNARSQGGTRVRSHTDVHLAERGTIPHISQRTGWDFHTLSSGDERKRKRLEETEEEGDERT